jgi:WD40 repeat protein
VAAVSVSPDGQQVISASDDHTIKVWDLGRGTLLADFDGEVPLYTCAVSQRGDVVCGGEAGRVHFLRLEQGRQAVSGRGEPRISQPNYRGGTFGATRDHPG